jgi:hypothetical protein
MKNISVHAVTTDKAHTTWKGEINKVQAFFPDSVNTTTTFGEVPDLFDKKGWKEYKGENEYDLDEDWLREQFKGVQANVIYLHLSLDEWDKLGFPDRLWGQSQTVGNVVVCYGRWSNRSDYRPSKHFSQPYRDFPEQTIGLAHEISHGLYKLCNPDQKDRTHYHFYGLQEVDSGDRYVRTPTPEKAFAQLNWDMLPEFNNSHVQPFTSRDPADLHPELRKRWHYIRQKFHTQHEGVLKLSATYRNKPAQTQEFREGNSKARWKESLHNYQPAYAFDCFIERNGQAVWDDPAYVDLNRYAQSVGLETLTGIGDPYHVQMPMTYKQAKQGTIPNLPTIKGQQLSLIKTLAQKAINLLQKLL